MFKVNDFKIPQHHAGFNTNIDIQEITAKKKFEIDRSLGEMQNCDIYMNQ